MSWLMRPSHRKRTVVKSTTILGTTIKQSISPRAFSFLSHSMKKLFVERLDAALIRKLGISLDSRLPENARRLQD
jgi:hypothetical protein